MTILPYRHFVQIFGLQTWRRTFRLKAFPEYVQDALKRGEKVHVVGGPTYFALAYTYDKRVYITGMNERGIYEI